MEGKKVIKLFLILILIIGLPSLAIGKIKYSDSKNNELIELQQVGCEPEIVIEKPKCGSKADTVNLQVNNQTVLASSVQNGIVVAHEDGIHDEECCEGHGGVQNCTSSGKVRCRDQYINEKCFCTQ